MNRLPVGFDASGNTIDLSNLKADGSLASDDPEVEEDSEVEAGESTDED